MPSHFSSIGFPVNSEDDFLALGRRIAKISKRISVSEGAYLFWESTSGAEIWLQVNNENNLIGMNPHFSGESKFQVGIASQVARPRDTVLDGAFYGWASPSEDMQTPGMYPFVFDSPDFRLHSSQRIPRITTVQIAAFADRISLFDSEDSLRASKDWEKFATKSFIPSGIFTPKKGPTNPPTAHGIFTGHILQAEKRINELTDRIFYWVLADSLGGTFDVIIDPELLHEEPKVSGILAGTFWLSGRILS